MHLSPKGMAGLSDTGDVLCKTETASPEHLLFPTIVWCSWRMTAPMISRCDSGCCCLGVRITENLHFNIKTNTVVTCFVLTATSNTLSWHCLSSSHQGSLSLEERKADLKLIASFSCPLCTVNNSAKRIGKFFMHLRIFLLLCCHSLYSSPFIYLAGLETDFNKWETSPSKNLCFTSQPLINCGFVFPFPAFSHA